MPQLRVPEAASFLGVSDDTIRRLVDSGTLSALTDAAGRRVVDGFELAMYAREQACGRSGPDVGEQLRPKPLPWDS